MYKQITIFISCLPVHTCLETYLYKSVGQFVAIISLQPIRRRKSDDIKEESQCYEPEGRKNQVSRPAPGRHFVKNYAGSWQVKIEMEESMFICRVHIVMREKEGEKEGEHT